MTYYYKIKSGEISPLFIQLKLSAEIPRFHYPAFAVEAEYRNTAVGADNTCEIDIFAHYNAEHTSCNTAVDESNSLAARIIFKLSEELAKSFGLHFNVFTAEWCEITGKTDIFFLYSLD